MSAAFDRLRSPSRGWRIIARMARHLECPWQLGGVCDIGLNRHLTENEMGSALVYIPWQLAGETG